MIFFGLMTVGAAILMGIFILIRVASTVYNRDIQPYVQRGERPPLFEFFNPKGSDVPQSEIDKLPLLPFDQFVSEYNDRKRNQLAEQHQEFLKTKLGKSYLRILHGTNK